MNFFLKIKDYINDNVSNDTLVCLACYGFVMGSYQIIKTVIHVPEKYLPHQYRDYKFDDLDSETETETEPISEYKTDSDSESEPEDPKDEDYVQPKNYTMKLRKRLRNSV